MLPERPNPAGGATRLAACVLVLVAACGVPASDGAEFGVELALTPSPPRVGAVEVGLVLTDSTGAPLRGADVRIEGNMNHAGMVPELADAEETAPGRYAAQIEFTMGGDWFFVVTAVTPEGASLERVIHVPGVASEETGPE